MKLMLIEDEKKEQDKFKKLAEKMNDERKMILME